MDQPARDWRVLDEPEDQSPEQRRAWPIGRVPLALIGVSAVLVVSVVATVWLAAAAGASREVVLDAQPSTGAAGAAAGELVVDVGGAVRRPGVYRLPAGSRVADAIAAAGGYGPSVDAFAAAELNLAAPVQDGAKVLIPQRGATARGSTGARPAASEQPRLVDLNNATQAELEDLPGIGPVIAKKIIDARAEAPFRRPDELTARKLVGPSTFEKIKALVTVRG